MSKGVTGKVLLTLDYPALESIGVLEFSDRGHILYHIGGLAIHEERVFEKEEKQK